MCAGSLGAGRGAYGCRRVAAQLNREGHPCSVSLVADLMREAGLRACQPRAYKRTTLPGEQPVTSPDLIRRDFTTDAARVNARWCGDITYIATWEGWLFLATVTGIASRRVVGFAMADHLRTELVADALVNAVAARDPDPGVVFHSDRGCQGGFNRSSQHLDHGGVRWDAVGSNCRTRRRVHVGSGRRIGRCGRRCGHRAGLSLRVRCSGSSGG